jgi:hypothetical protein
MIPRAAVTIPLTLVKNPMAALKKLRKSFRGPLGVELSGGTNATLRLSSLLLQSETELNRS